MYLFFTINTFVCKLCVYNIIKLKVVDIFIYKNYTFYRN